MAAYSSAFYALGYRASSNRIRIAVTSTTQTIAKPSPQLAINEAMDSIFRRRF